MMAKTRSPTRVQPQHQTVVNTVNSKQLTHCVWGTAAGGECVNHKQIGTACVHGGRGVYGGRGCTAGRLQLETMGDTGGGVMQAVPATAV